MRENPGLKEAVHGIEYSASSDDIGNWILLSGQNLARSSTSLGTGYPSDWPGRHDPLVASQLRADTAPPNSQRHCRVALLHVRRPAAAQRAPRALEEDRREVLTAKGP